MNYKCQMAPEKIIQRRMLSYSPWSFKSSAIDVHHYGSPAWLEFFFLYDRYFQEDRTHRVTQPVIPSADKDINHSWWVSRYFHVGKPKRPKACVRPKSGFIMFITNACCTEPIQCVWVYQQIRQFLTHVGDSSIRLCNSGSNFWIQFTTID